MRNSTRPRSLAWLVPTGVLTLSLAAFGWLSAQGPDSKKPPPEQEESAKPVIRKQLPDDDDSGGKTKVPARVGDESGKRTPQAERPGVLKPADLALEASRTGNADLRAFYERLAVPHDIIRKPAGGVSYVAPIPQYIGESPRFGAPIKVQLLDHKTLQPRLKETFKRDEVESVEHYEEFAINQVDRFLNDDVVPKRVALRAAEKALTAVLGFYESALESGERDRDSGGWDRVGRQLRRKLREVKIRQLAELPLRDQQEWEAASDYADDLKRLYPDETDVQEAVVGLQLKRAQTARDENDFEAVRKSLERLERLSPNNKRAEEYRRRLASEAQKLLDAARTALAAKKRDEAQQLLTRAEKIWPRLPGLRDEQLKLENSFPILYVGVRQLPQHLWPGTARLDSERQAVEMLFESLVRPHYEPDLGLTYEPALARDRPNLIPLGRRFDMLPNAYWSDGSQVTAADVRRTLELFKSSDWPGYRPECKDLLDAIRVGSDPFQVNVTLHQGYLDPLALMAFKVLPEGHLNRVGAWDREDPVGSGPFRLKKEQPGHNLDNRPVLVFEANPFYRGGNQDLPRIREIHFVQAPSLSEFKAGKVHLLLNASTHDVKQMQDDPAFQDVTFKTLPNRRIYFLAINHRRIGLRGPEHADLRRALNHALDREEVLNKIFRDGLKCHRALTGPYPPESWACNPKMKSLYQPERAKLQAENAKIEPDTKLSLKYPSDDPQVAQACEYIKKAIESIDKNHNLQIGLEALPPAELVKKVEGTHDYDLAYYSWDYPTEDYWLFPLLDPRADAAMRRDGGTNFLGYQNDRHLQGLFHKVMVRREFKEVQKITHDIHTHLFDEASGMVPFIPLWQLDTHVAYTNDLKPVGLDPLLVFTHVEEWRLERR